MSVSAGHIAYGLASLLFAVFIMVYLARDKFPRDRRRCTAVCEGSFVRMEPMTGLPVIRMFPPESTTVEFLHVRPIWHTGGKTPAYGTKVSVYYDPNDPRNGPHVLAQEIGPHAKPTRNLVILATVLAVTGAVLIGCGLVPAA